MIEMEERPRLMKLSNSDNHTKTVFENIIPTWNEWMSYTSSHIRSVHQAMYLTFSGQHSDADTGVTELDEGQAACLPVLLSD